MEKRKFKRKRLVSLMLIFSLILTFIPQVAFAADSPKAGYEVVFKYDDGRPDQKMAKDSSFTLSPLDQGHFEVVGADQSAVRWEFGKKYTTPAGEYGTWYYITYKGGKYQPLIKEDINGYVEIPNASNINFKIKNIESGITELKPYVDGKEIAKDETVFVSGSENKKFDVKGVIGDKLVNVPVQALVYDRKEGDGFLNTTNGMFQVHNGKAIFRAYLREDYFADWPEDIMTTITAEATDVPLTDINVRVPKVWYIDSWNGLADYYVGIQRGDKDNQWNCTYTPYNATGRELKWEALTPEIADYMDAFDNGIIPKKAGIAKFKVSSVKYPEVSKEVSIEFRYKNPLTAAKPESSEFTVEEGESKEFKINPTPALATEQRFHWTYSTDGIVEVVDTVSQDALNVNTPKTFTHKIKALETGVVEVTGTPYDTTGDCKPVKFTVVVTLDGVSPIDPEDEAKDVAGKDLKHGVEYLKGQDLNKYGKEWNLFALLRAGETVDKDVLDAYYESVVNQVNDESKFGSMQATDIARVVLTLEAMGKNPAKTGDRNLIEALYNSKTISDISGLNYTLLALDGWKSEIPENAKWTRELLIKEILKSQMDDGGFAFSTMFGSDVDVTAVALQALAPYNNDEHKDVQKAVKNALGYLKKAKSENAGFGAWGENAASAAQVLTALTSLGINPVDKANGFVLGSKNIIKNLHSFKAENGFGFSDGNKGMEAATQQSVYALASYVRMLNNETKLFDLTDKKPAHVHEFADKWVTDENGHWHQCECGEKAEFAAHEFEWVVDKEATETETGLKHEECTVCGYKKDSVEIPVITPVDPDKPVTPEKPEKPGKPEVTPEKPGKPDAEANKPADKKPATSNPQTGDTANTEGLVLLLGACIAAFAITYRKKSEDL